ncbi:MAG: SDR family oxidoreductase [Candidatus Sulfotelmatobacter sp.]
MRILVSGATGYVGSRLIPRLVASGHEVSCMVRDASRVDPRVAESTRIVVADALQPESVAAAMQDIDVAYYLIHSMSASGGDFQERDRLAAHSFAVAARQAGVSRIIYLGGLASETSQISSHLKSRHETGAALRRFGPPVTEFRAGIIVGNGSVSFELIRYLTERLPVMICPRWVITRTQPIAIDDVLNYLVAVLQSPESTGQVIEIGGATTETYRSMMLTYAQARRLRRWLLRVPVLTPRLSSYWLRLVTPIPTSIARPLIEGLRTEVVCKSARAAELFPAIRPMGYAAAIERTLTRTLPDDSLRETLPCHPAHVFTRRDGVLCDIRQAVADASPKDVFSVITQLGGSNGYLYANSLWRIRGWLDQCLGGAGMKRSSGSAHLNKNDHIDFWYVQDLEADRRLLLRAEMKLPGRAWLEFLVSPQPSGRTLVRCCAWFEPRGLLGELYWWVLYPVHILIFRGMVQAMCRKATRSVTIQPAYMGPHA